MNRKPMNRKMSIGVFGWLGMVWLLLMFVLPVAWVVRGGFFVEGRFTIRYLLYVFRNPIYYEGLRNSLGIAIGTTLTAMVPALTLAWVAHRFEFRGKRVLTALALMPMVLPPFVGVIGFQQMLGAYGVLNTLMGWGAIDWLGQGRVWGVILLQALGLYPILYLNAAAALANVDPAMEEAAANLGAGGWRRFRNITLPLMAPGLFAGGTIVFIWSFTELGTPLMLNYTRCVSVQIYDALMDIGSSPFPYALVSVTLAASLFLYAMGKWRFGRHAHAMQSKAGTGHAPRYVTGGAAALAALPFVLVSLIALLPHLGVILTSFSRAGSWYGTVLPAEWTSEHYQHALGHSMTLGAIRNSLLFSSLAVLLNLVLGVGMAFAIVRSRSRWRHSLDVLAMLPLAVPGLIMAFGYLALSAYLANLGWVKESTLWSSIFDIRINPTFFLVTAYAVRRLPYMIRAAVAGLQQTAEVYEEAAANLGARPLTAARRIVLPLISANLIAGAVLAFSFCMLEVSDSLMLAQRADYYPITKAIYELSQMIGTGRFLASALGVWAMVFLAATLVGATLLLGKRLGALFRV